MSDSLWKSALVYQDHNFISLAGPTKRRMKIKLRKPHQGPRPKKNKVLPIVKDIKTISWNSPFRKQSDSHLKWASLRLRLKNWELAFCQIEIWGLATKPKHRTVGIFSLRCEISPMRWMTRNFNTGCGLRLGLAHLHWFTHFSSLSLPIPNDDVTIWNLPPCSVFHSFSAWSSKVVFKIVPLNQKNRLLRGMASAEKRFSWWG